MAHPRALIRQAVVALLIAADTAAEARVEATREIPRRRGDGPALGVYTPEESVASSETRTAPREHTRSLTLVIEGIVSGASGVDDALDDLAQEVEDALDADDTLGGTAAESSLVSTDLEVMEDSGRTVGLIRLTYTVVYYTFAPREVDAPDAFESASVKHDLNGTTYPADQAEDIVEPEQ
jgi:hypothetical protein